MIELVKSGNKKWKRGSWLNYKIAFLKYSLDIIRSRTDPHIQQLWQFILPDTQNDVTTLSIHFLT
jgi:hypothetical protein